MKGIYYPIFIPSALEMWQNTSSGASFILPAFSTPHLLSSEGTSVFGAFFKGTVPGFCRVQLPLDLVVSNGRTKTSGPGSCASRARLGWRAVARVRASIPRGCFFLVPKEVLIRPLCTPQRPSSGTWALWQKLRSCPQLFSVPGEIREPFWHVTHECIARVGGRACRPTTGEKKGISPAHKPPGVAQPEV